MKENPLSRNEFHPRVESDRINIHYRPESIRQEGDVSPGRYVVQYAYPKDGFILCRDVDGPRGHQNITFQQLHQLLADGDASITLDAEER